MLIQLDPCPQATTTVLAVEVTVNYVYNGMEGCDTDYFTFAINRHSRIR